MTARPDADWLTTVAAEPATTLLPQTGAGIPIHMPNSHTGRAPAKANPRILLVVIDRSLT
jgi:hypothetical protein